MNRAPAWTALAGLAVFAGALEARSEDPAPTNAVDVVSDTTWSGEVRLARPIRVGMGATLRIAPGTRITIPWVEAGGRESAEKPGIEVAGRLVAGGDANAPIRFEPERMPSAVTRAGWKRWRGILVLDGAAASA